MSMEQKSPKDKRRQPTRRSVASSSASRRQSPAHTSSSARSSAPRSSARVNQEVSVRTDSSFRQNRVPQGARPQRNVLQAPRIVSQGDRAHTNNRNSAPKRTKEKKPLLNSNELARAFFFLSDVILFLLLDLLRPVPGK